MSILEERLIALYCDTLELSKNFQKKNYQNQIQSVYDEYQDLYQMLQEKLADSDEDMRELALCVPNYAAEAMKDMPKRKQQLKKVDNNMAMVSYFVPLMGKIRSDQTDAFVDLLVQSWNETFSDSRIGKSNVDEIQNGFKKGLCYITTAVCTSFGKPDDCYELSLLRDYRDHYLMSSEEGASIVKEYYNIAPTIVNRIDKEENSGEIYRTIWNHYLEQCVHMIEQDQMEECKDTYSAMMHELEKKYLYS